MPLSDEYETPPEIFNPLNAVYRFRLDAAASKSNHLCARYFTEEDNALVKRWIGGPVWCNPPYSKAAGPVLEWVKKGYRESLEGEVVVMLLLADTSTTWFHGYVHEYGDVRFLKTRIRHLLGGVRQGAPKFGSLVVEFNGLDEPTGLLWRADL